VDKVPTQSQDAGKSSIRSVRRISNVRWHKRQKSGTAIPLAVGRLSLGSQPDVLPVQEAAEDISVQELQQLLPHVEIQTFPECQDHLSVESQMSSSSPTEEVIYQPEDADSHIIKPSLPQTSRKTGDPRTPPMSPTKITNVSGKGTDAVGVFGLFCVLAYEEGW
jgi:hypothetical protein